MESATKQHAVAIQDTGVRDVFNEASPAQALADFTLERTVSGRNEICHPFRISADQHCRTVLGACTVGLGVRPAGVLDTAYRATDHKNALAGNCMAEIFSLAVNGETRTAQGAPQMKIKVKFLNDNGTEVVATFDRDAGTVTAQDGRTGTYSRPDGSKVMELKGAENITLTFQDDIKFEPGFSTRYTGSDGRKGTVTILSIS